MTHYEYIAHYHIFNVVLYAILFNEIKSKQAKFTRFKPTTLDAQLLGKGLHPIINCSRNKKELMRASSIKMTLLLFYVLHMLYAEGGFLYLFG